MSNFPILSFNSGELTDLLDARSDIDKYASGCRTLQNMIPRIYGAAIRRPGSMYIAEVKDSTKEARLIPFEYSTAISYVIELGDLYARFYTGGAQLISGTPVTLVTTYLEADLFEIQYKQVNDVMWLTHGDYPQRKLTRTSATSFSIANITFKGGPFRTRNDILNDDGVTITPGATTGSTTLTASSATFSPDHVGAFFQLTQPRVNTDTSGSKASTGVIGTSLAVEGDFSFNTHGTWTATVELQRNADGTNWETYRTYTGANDRNIQLTANEPEKGVLYRINVTSYTSGTINADLSVHDSTQKGYGVVTAYNSATSVDITVVDDFASTDATLRWAEGAWSAVHGYPRTVTFFGERAIYAGTTTDPQTIWFSAVDDFEDFYAGTNDDDSFSVSVSSDKRNAIQWIASLERVVFGTTGGEWFIGPTIEGDPITPTRFIIRQQTSYGSKPLQATTVNDSVLYVDRAARKIREMTFVDAKQKYTAPDITALAEHITSGGIVDVAYQRNPESIIWMVLGASPWLISVSYNRDQDVIAAARHPVGGSGEVESVAVIPGSEEDEVWVSVKRTIDGQTKRYVEQLQAWDWGSDDDDAFFVDSGLIYSGASATSITGLDHLEGEEVEIWGNGAIQAAKTVASGTITLDTAVTKAIIGLAYTYRLKPMKLDHLSSAGTTRGSKKKITEIVARFKDTLDVEYGDGTTFYPIKWPQSGWSFPLSTGDYRLSFDGGFSDTIVFQGNGPAPCTIISLVPRMDQIGR